MISNMTYHKISIIGPWAYFCSKAFFCAYFRVGLFSSGLIFEWANFQGKFYVSEKKLKFIVSNFIQSFLINLTDLA